MDHDLFDGEEVSNTQCIQVLINHEGLNREVDHVLEQDGEVPIDDSFQLQDQADKYFAAEQFAREVNAAIDDDGEVTPTQIRYCERMEANAAEEQTENQVQDVTDAIEGGSSQVGGQPHKLKCGYCGKTFIHRQSLRRHEKVHKEKTFKCSECGKCFHRLDMKKKHEKSHKKRRASSAVFSCELCDQTFGSDFELEVHRRREHVDHELRIRRRLDEEAFSQMFDQGVLWTNDEGEIDERLRDLYLRYADAIFLGHETGAIQNVYNFPIHNDTIREWLTLIYNHQRSAFKINFSFSFILRNIENGEYRFFYAHNNNSILSEPFVISRLEDVERLIELLESLDFLQQAIMERDGSKWVVYRIVNIRFVVTMLDYALGSEVVIPPHIKNNRFIITLDKNRHNGTTFNDTLCFFRCLALFRQRKQKPDEVKPQNKLTNQLKEQWLSTLSLSKKNRFDGLALNDVPEAEDVFATNINIYSLDKENNCSVVYHSRSKYQDVLHMNVYENHLSLITDLSQYCKTFKCRNCDKLFPKPFTLSRHEQSCADATKLSFPGGYKCLPSTLFEEMEEIGIKVDEKHRYFPFFITYDFESLLVPCDNSESFAKLKWVTEHKPISVSVCSNVPGYEGEKCIINSKAEDLIDQMVAYMCDISKQSSKLMKETFGAQMNSLMSSFLANDDPRRLEKDIFDPKTEMDRICRRLFGKLSIYCSQIPVLGFNSARYDLNLIKNQLLPRLKKSVDEDKDLTVLKKGSAYTSIATPDLKFLDVSNFLAAGCSYDGFLKAYDCSMKKGFFPYEWFDSAEKLSYPRLPKYESFFSSLKNCNVLEEEHNKYSQLVKQGLSRQETLKIMKLKETPKTGKENYQFLHRLWQSEKMQTFSNYLTWYNNLDVKPFVEAATKMCSFYKEKGVDLFKQAFSAPGVARQLVFKSVNTPTHFSLIDQDNVDLHHKIKNNIVGGPSIIFKRYHEVGKTKIRGGEKICQNIVGFDANALYLWCFGEDMPTGPFVRRKLENNFRPEKRDKYITQYRWLDYVAHKQKCHIQHGMNGKEKRIGPYPVDGFCAETNTVLQYDGCYYHGHSCHLTRRQFEKEDTKALMNKRAENTKKRDEYIKSRGHNLVVMSECEFYAIAKTDPLLKTFLQRYRKPCDHISSFQSNEEIIQHILADRIFGMVECDIRVPDHLKERFSEMCPIFKNVEIPYEVIGDHMQRHVEAFKLSKKPRRSLIGSLFGEKILLATPLLQWYLRQGLEVTKIYEVVEYDREPCFRPFMDEVSDARRKGDSNPDYAIVADTMKLIGNSSYGSMIMDKTKHRDTVYVEGKHEAHFKVNNRRFRKLTELGESVYELEMSKSNLNMDLPIQLGFFILQYAKLRMLDFYYNLIDRFVPRDCFEYLEMDTDSAYLAIAGKTLESVIPPNLRSSFEKEKKLWFPRTHSLEVIAFDKRTPGLFKIEFEGDVMVGLCSKLYCIVKRSEENKNRDVTKFSCKGVRKSQIQNPINIYKSVLENEKSYVANNIGFRLHNERIKTYNQTKIGVVYFYSKRVVLADGVSTTPLDL